MRLSNHFLINSNPKRLGMPSWSFHPNAAKEVYVTPARYTFLFIGEELGGTKEYSCGVPVHETFEQDRDYELSFNWNRTECTVQVNELKEVDGVAVRIPIRVHTNLITAATRGCLTQFSKPRLY